MDEDENDGWTNEDDLRMIWLILLSFTSYKINNIIRSEEIYLFSAKSKTTWVEKKVMYSQFVPFRCYSTE